MAFFDDKSNPETLTSAVTAAVIAAVTPLTAEFRDAPDKHEGTGAFTFYIAFSEPISIGYVTLRDDSLDVTNGSVTKAKRVDGQSDRWEITVDPNSDADVTVVLPITENCAAQDAVCTRDGTKLSNRSELTRSGSGCCPTLPPPAFPPSAERRRWARRSPWTPPGLTTLTASATPPSPTSGLPEPPTSRGQRGPATRR